MYTPMTLQQKLAKTAASLSSHVARGNRETGRQSLALIDRYQDLRESCSTAQWQEHCRRLGYSERHTAYDFFA